MNILVSANDRYIKPLKIMLCSLFKHEKAEINIYLLYSEVSRKNLAGLSVFICQNGGRFIPIRVKDGIFDHAPVVGYLTKEMYYRVLGSELLPQSLERVLYLDSDIIICNSIKQLYDMDFCGKMLIGVLDMENYIDNNKISRRKRRLGLTEDDVYINSGVLLFNLNKMRKEFILKEFLVDVEKNREILEYPDQDEINRYFRGDIGTTDIIYNYPSCWSLFCGYRRYFSVKHLAVIHYMGNSKPWEMNYIGRFFLEYYRYLRQFQSKKEKKIMLLKPFFSIVELLVHICRCVFRKKKLEIDE